MDRDIHHGFKRITVENWNKMDWIIQFPSPVPPEAWVNACLKPQLKQSVPEEIRGLFEVARGSAIYGWFFYPLITLAAEQSHRVMEAAARKGCERHGIPTKAANRKGELRDINFNGLIEALAAAGIISEMNVPRWEATRSLRNSSSHPNRQCIFSTGDAVMLFESAAELINEVFEKASPTRQTAITSAF